VPEGPVRCVLNECKPPTPRLGTPGVLIVGTLSDAPPSICVNSQGQFTGFDNELLRAIANKVGLKVNFVGTEFSGLLAQVASGRFDVGSSSITTTEARRRTVGFTNGYDFGYFSPVVPTGSPITGFDKLAAGQRIGVVHGTVHEACIIDTLHLDPVKFIVMWTRRAEVDPVAGVVGWSGAGAAGQTGWRSRFGGACRRGWLATAACVSVPTTPSRRR
jgi:polar amino acid transport system substrate-binding protein